MADLFLNNRIGWEDVEPVIQNDGPDPVSFINYKQEYVSSMDLFRAVMKSNEYSERVLQLTAEILESNPANYSAWQYRRQCLDAMKYDLYVELRFSEEITYDTSKNYQVWYHRRAIVERLGDPSAELPFISNILLEDGKNYHAWSYRQWILLTYGNEKNLWGGELDAMHRLLSLDHFNNSAWNHRFFVVSRHDDGLNSSDVVEREVTYAFNWIAKERNNECPWNYLRGLMRNKHHATSSSSATKGKETKNISQTNEMNDWKFKQYPMLKKEILSLLTNNESNDKKNIHLYGLLYDIYEDEVKDNELMILDKKLNIFKELHSLYAILCEIDKVKAPYWNYRFRELPPIPS